MKSKLKYETETPEIQYLYSANGLTIASEIEFLELRPGEGEPDVYIRYGEVPEKIDNAIAFGPRFEARPGQYLFNLKGIARYYVKDGNTVFISPEPGASEDRIRISLLTSVFGALAHQRGFLPIHASAVEINGEAVLFAGDSGSGKSTIASGFHKRGYKVLADDISAITFDQDSKPMVHQSYNQLKLWADTLGELGEIPEKHRKLRPELEKYGMLVDKEKSAPIPVKYMFINHSMSGDVIEFIELRSMEKLLALKHQTFRYRLIEGLSNKADHFKRAQSLANHVKVSWINRPYHPFDLDKLLNAIETEIAL